MDKYNDIVPTEAARSTEWRRIKGWTEKFICGVLSEQNVVGHRSRPNGGTVTRADFTAKDRVAQVCPFVDEAIAKDLFWIERSPLTDLHKIGDHMVSLIGGFKKCPPAHDPLGTTSPSHATLLKTFMAFFPSVALPRTRVGWAPNPNIDQMYLRIRSDFRQEGLMLGQFYRGCDVGAVYNPQYRNIFTSPYLALAIRYMQPHDHLFIKESDPGYDVYTKLYPSSRP